MSGKFWSQNKEWRNYLEIRVETTAHCSKTRDLRQKRNKLPLKSYLKHKLDILGSNENNFLNNLRQSSSSYVETELLFTVSSQRGDLTNKAIMGLYNQSWEFEGQNSHILFLGIPRIFLRIPKSLLKGSFQIDSEFGSWGKVTFSWKWSQVQDIDPAWRCQARNETFGSHPNLKTCRQMSPC